MYGIGNNCTLLAATPSQIKRSSPTAPSGNLNLLISSRNSFDAYRAFSHSSTSALALQLPKNASLGDPLIDRNMLIRVQLMPSFDLA